MRRRAPNPRRAKIHRNYAVDEIARLFGVHRNTVRNWIKQGLAAIDDRTPTVIQGQTLRLFLEGRRKNAKRPCPPGQLYCVRCRAPTVPALQMVDYIAFTATIGNLTGLCPDCGCVINRRVARSQIDAVWSKLDVRFPQAHPHIGESTVPTVNCDSKESTTR